MGGYGSTRWGWYNKKRTVEQSLRMDVKTFISNLKKGEGRSGSLSWSNGCNIAYHVTPKNEGWVLQLTYQITRHGDKIDADYTIPILPTPMPNGGVRYWFYCPLQGCTHRRIQKLYLPPGSTYFGCRKCHELVYRSSQESRKLNNWIMALGRAEGFTPSQLRRAFGW